MRGIFLDRVIARLSLHGSRSTGFDAVVRLAMRRP
jgi:hypothetical protein